MIDRDSQHTVEPDISNGMSLIFYGGSAALNEHLRPMRRHKRLNYIWQCGSNIQSNRLYKAPMTIFDHYKP